MKVLTVVGTRPELIRLSRVIARLEAEESVQHILVHTGQNYDYELNQVFFEDLQLRQPDYFLNTDRSSVGSLYGTVLIESEKVLIAERPDALLVLGDTNSAIVAIMARRLKIPIFHMEAGNRSFDLNVPEETNRMIVDHISDFNLVYTEHARRNLLSEGVHPRRVFLTGSPLYEVIQHYRTRIDQSDVLDQMGLESRGFFLVSLHREENVDFGRNLRSLLSGLQLLAQEYGKPVVVSTHPRTRKRLESGYLEGLDPLVSFLKPFGFLDYMKLQLESSCVISDSGSISEESGILGFPAVTPRNSMERPEALDAGTVILSGLEPMSILRCVTLARNDRSLLREFVPPGEYRVSNVSDRVLRLILGLSGLSRVWGNLLLSDGPV